MENGFFSLNSLIDQDFLGKTRLFVHEGKFLFIFLKNAWQMSVEYGYSYDLWTIVNNNCGCGAKRVEKLIIVESGKN